MTDPRTKKATPPTKKAAAARKTTPRDRAPAPPASDARTRVPTAHEPTANYLTTTAALIAYLVLACLFVHWSPLSASLVPNEGPSYFSTSDASLSVWFLAWLPYALTHSINPAFSHAILSPSGVPISHAASIFALAALGSPVTAAIGPIAAYNVLLRLAFAASASSMFLVLRTKVRAPYAFGAGLLFGFGPFVVVQGATHLDLAFVAMLPIIVWLTHELFVVRRRSARVLGCWLGAACAIQYYVSNELLLMVIVVMIIGGAVGGIRYRRSTNWRYLLEGGLYSVGVFIVLCGYMIYELAFVGAQGPAHPLAVLEQYRGDLLSPVIPTALQWFHPGHSAQVAASYVGQNPTENSGYIGVPLLVVALWLGGRFRRMVHVLCPLLLAAAAFVLSLGPKLTVNRHTMPIPMPEALLTHLPVTNSIVSARFSVVVWLFLVVALAFGAQAFFDSIRANGRHNRYLIGAIGFVALVLVAVTLWPTTYPSSNVAVSPAMRDALAQVPRGNNVLNYPLAVPVNNEPMIWQAQEKFRFNLVGGTDGVGVVVVSSIGAYFIEAQTTLDWRGVVAAQLGARNLAKVRQYLASRHIGAVVVQDSGADPEAVAVLLNAVVGPPSYQHAGIAVWLTHSASHGRSH